MNIRKMTEADVPQVAEIERRSFSMPWSEDAFLDSLSYSYAHFLVAEEEERIMGYVGMYVSLDEGEITNVAVHPDCRGKGVAQALMREMQREAEQLSVPRILLEVRVSNADAIHVYEKSGYTELGVRKNFYEKPKEDGLLMELKLSI